MATKADFTADEWESKQKGVIGAGMFVAVSEPGFFDSFKEGNALEDHLRGAHAHSENELVRSLSEEHRSPFAMTSSEDEVEQVTLDSLHKAIAALKAKSPDDLSAYRQLVLGVAEAVAQAAKGVSAAETGAIDTIRTALFPPEADRPPLA